MGEEFKLPVVFKGKEMELVARLLNYGYSSKLEVEIEGTKVIFEPDEERIWRAVISYQDLIANKMVSKELLETVAEVIQNASK